MVGLGDCGGLFQPKGFRDSQRQSPWGQARPLLALALTRARDGSGLAPPDQQ